MNVNYFFVWKCNVEIVIIEIDNVRMGNMGHKVVHIKIKESQSHPGSFFWGVLQGNLCLLLLQR